MNATFPGNENVAEDIAWNPQELVRSLRAHVRWWVVPTVVCAVLAAAYSLVAPRWWEASQALIVRPEAATVSEERHVKFSDLSEMKTLQETILELTRSQSVVTATLKTVGPPAGYRHSKNWPTAVDVEDFREAVSMSPPGGAEFGKTEVFYLSVQNTNRARAAALVDALCKQLEQRMQQLRDQSAQSMITELERTVDMANGDLSEETRKLTAFEATVGADLNELRSLNAQVGTQGGVSLELQAIEAERRANDATHRENVRLLAVLTDAANDSRKLLATPSSLLKSQTSIAQLKDAFVAAQIHTAGLLGSRSEEHPFVIAAREAEESIRTRLHDEVKLAIRGLQIDVELGAEREQALAKNAAAAQARIARLAGSRAEYANLVASVENHGRVVEAARKNLADVRARQAGARSASVISRIDDVEAGIRPVGASRKSVTAAGGVAGLLLGLGGVFLFTGTSPAASIVSIEPVAPRGAQGHAAPPAKPRECTPASSNCGPSSCGNTSRAANLDVNLFGGMTLEQAIRHVEQEG